MPRRYIGIALSLSAWLTAAHASAQTTRSEQITDEKIAKAADVRPAATEKGDGIVARLQNLLTSEPPAIRLTLGDFRPGAGLAAGVGYIIPIGARGVWSTSTAWSVKNFRQVESAVDIPLATDRIRVRAFVKWDDAPEFQFFGLGASTSPGDEVGYGFRSAEAGGELQARGARWFTYGMAASYLSVGSTDGTGSTPSIGSLATTDAVAGIGSSPVWWHTQAYAAIDWRQSPGYTDSGGLYRIAFHDYLDRGGAFDFRRTEIDLRQFLPVLHDNWIIALQARADLTSSADGQAVPFFMLPSIGGRDTLPGFADYRFTDNNSLLLRGELRWTPLSVVDMAVFLDQGTVAATAGALALHDLKRDWGIGVRFHGPTFTALRLEVAHSIEGWRYNIAHNISF